MPPEPDTGAPDWLARLFWLRCLDAAAAQMWSGHPDLSADRDCVVLTFEDINELKLLDYEIAIEHTHGDHHHGCPLGCLFRVRSQ
jgi:hypothetical protein